MPIFGSIFNKFFLIFPFWNSVFHTRSKDLNIFIKKSQMVPLYHEIVKVKKFERSRLCCSTVVKKNVMYKILSIDLIKRFCLFWKKIRMMMNKVVIFQIWSTVVCGYINIMKTTSDFNLLNIKLLNRMETNKYRSQEKLSI